MHIVIMQILIRHEKLLTFPGQVIMRVGRVRESAGLIQEDKDKANLNTVSIIASGTSSLYTRFAEEIFQVLDDPKGNELRILPVLGRGGVHNMFDILNLRGVDMGVMDDTMLEVYKKTDPVKYANIPPGDGPNSKSSNSS
jgi:TRAP-type uncharacterized transport system substrate-binding protein